ncbi:MAG: ferrous iron transport protein B [Phycisphaera sp.]|nr:ferrous iron transport protein B [Phycisphaera sp.]
MTQLAAQSVDSAAQRRPQVALVGNPNTGKSALFNRLTGARQRVGNFPGLTIEKRLGTMRLEREGERVDVDVIDLPGLYSLAAVSPDERVVLDALTGHVEGTARPDLIVCVVDVCNLRRNLFLATQIAEVGLPMVLVLNMWDAAEAAHLTVDVEALSARLGIPVIRTVASKGRGVDELKAAIDAALSGATDPRMRQIDWPIPVRDASAALGEPLKQLANRSVMDVERRRLLFDVESSLADELAIDTDQWTEPIEAARQIIRHGGYDPAHVETTVRYQWIDGVLANLIETPETSQRPFSESIDDLLTHRVFGVLIFGAIMYVVFQSIYTLAGPFMDAIDAGFGWLGDTVGAWLAGTPMLQSMVVDGMIAGVGGVLVFLPQIIILFLFISLLEDAGYMPRAAFLMDRLFGWCGLSGKSFVPMLSSFACAVPGIMAARTVQEPKARLTTILVCPLMSCSARLPVYVLLIGAFIEPLYGKAWAGFALFAMHFVGLAIAIPVAFVFNRLVLKGRRTPFVLEMPPYRVPQWRDVVWRVYTRAREFVVRAGTVIFAMSIVIWAMCYFPRPDAVREQVITQHVEQVAAAQSISVDEARAALEADDDAMASVNADIEGAYLEQSVMGRLGRTVQPVFAPAGYDWKITVGVLASFPAREVIISTLGILYHLGEDTNEESTSLVSAMRSAKHDDGRAVFNPIVAVGIMVFFALCSQCAATLVTIAKESNWRWAVFSFVYMTALAWVGAVFVYQVGTAIFGSA